MLNYILPHIFDNVSIFEDYLKIVQSDEKLTVD